MCSRLTPTAIIGPVVHHGNKETAFVILKRYDNNQKIILKTPPVFQGDDA
jgi:hypothetical protein